MTEASTSSIGYEKPKQESGMGRNQIKVVSSVSAKTLAFYLKNEHDEWCRISNLSLLSRKKYISAYMKEIAGDMIRVILSDYNPGDRGVDIHFEGSKDDYVVLRKALASQDAISCHIQQTMMIAVAGKSGSGKTTLITEIGRAKGKEYLYSETDDVPTYTDAKASVVWHEMRGIDIGPETVMTAKSAFEELARCGLQTFVYCLDSSKLESSEEDFIRFVRHQYCSMKVLIVLTRCIVDKGELLAEQLADHLDGIKVIPLLAKEIKTRSGTISAYGLTDIDRYIFEG